MNIAVLGSNCKFSSDLAVQLNKLKQSSLVYRYDALANFKKDIPLYKSLLKNADEGPHQVIDVDFEVLDEQTAENTNNKKTSAFGEYIGDVETKFLEQPKKDETVKKLNTLKGIFETLNTKVDDKTPTYGYQCLLEKLRENQKNTQLFASGLLNVINVYSGILNKEMLDLLIVFEPLTIVIKVKNNNNFIPCTITEEQLKKATEENPQLIILEVSSIDELLHNNFFISTFNLKEKRREEKQKVGTVTTAVEPLVVELYDAALMAQAGAGLMHQMAAMAA